MKLYQQFCNSIGANFSIKNGLIELDRNGIFKIVDVPGIPGTLYINHIEEIGEVVPTNYMGYLDYKIGKHDCVTLALSYFDQHKGTSLKERYLALDREALKERWTNGVSNYATEYNFVETTEEIQPFDLVVYLYNGISRNHIGIVTEDLQLLHQIPRRLSCKDAISSRKIYKRFRYGQ